MSAHTPGPWGIFISRIGHSDEIRQTEEPWAMICEFPYGAEGSVHAANASLIAEAGTVATETGLTPRHLAEQRAELLEACRRAHEWLQGSEPHRATYIGEVIAKCGVKP